MVWMDAHNPLTKPETEYGKRIDETRRTVKGSSEVFLYAKNVFITSRHGETHRTREGKSCYLCQINKNSRITDCEAGSR